MSENPKVLLETSLGNITVELFEKEAPVTVANFLAYVDDNYYAGTIFHRVIKGFMIQGGGLDENLRNVPGRAPIKNEAGNGLSNTRLLSPALAISIASASASRRRALSLRMWVASGLPVPFSKAASSLTSSVSANLPGRE